MLKNSKATVLGLALATTMSVASPAQSSQNEPSFNFFGVHYQKFSSERGGDFDGASLEVSGHLRERWVLSASYAQLSTDSATHNGDIDWDVTYGRLGYLAYNDRQLAVSVGPQVQYISYELPNTSSALSDTSFGAFADVRYQLSSQVELQSRINYLSAAYADNNNFLQYELGARVFLSHRFALEGRLQLGDWDGVTFGGSVHF